jgi:hypothetical protein
LAANVEHWFEIASRATSPRIFTGSRGISIDRIAAPLKQSRRKLADRTHHKDPKDKPLLVVVPIF